MPTTSQYPVTVTTLKYFQIFSGLPPVQLEGIFPLFSRQRIERGTDIIAEGDSSEAMYFILSGKAKVILRNNKEREFIVSFLKGGDYFGEMGLIDDMPRSASVMAVTACELLVLPRENFDLLLQVNTQIARHIMQSLSKRMRQVIRKLESLAMMDVYGRIARVLLDGSDEVDGEYQFRYKLSKQELANMIGASREMVTRVMKDLEDEGLIQYRDGRLLISNAGADV
jgi:CRP/FNR family cyclic AMP-dependent transcriptional regulator